MPFNKRHSSTLCPVVKKRIPHQQDAGEATVVRIRIAAAVHAAGTDMVYHKKTADKHKKTP
jgi:hypothetical protein